MSYLTFSRGLQKELGKASEHISNVVTKAGKAAIRAARFHTPAPWNGGSKYSTGTLYNNWKISTQRRGTHIPVRHRQPKTNLPNFRYRSRFDDRIYIYNNTPYASYVEDGINPKASVSPRPMLSSAIQAFEQTIRIES